MDLFISQVTPFLQTLADKLGTTVDNLWTIYVLQVKVEMFQDIFYGVLFFILLLNMKKLFTWIFKEEHHRSYGDLECEYAALGIVIGIGMVIYGLITFFGLIPEIINCAVNPDYMVLKRILSDISSMMPHK